MVLVMADISQYSIHKATSITDNQLDPYVDMGIELDGSDYFIQVEPKFSGKPGWLSNELFGTPRLVWVFIIFNPDIIADPITDIKGGMTLRVPTKERLLAYF